MIQPANMERS